MGMDGQSRDRRGWSSLGSAVRGVRYGGLRRLRRLRRSGLRLFRAFRRRRRRSRSWSSTSSTAATPVSFAKVVEAVEKAQPDVIGLEEAETNTGRLARAAGYPYWSDATQVVSRFPLLEPPDAKGHYVFVRGGTGYGASRCRTCTCRRTLRSARIRVGGPRSRSSRPRASVRLPYIQTAARVLPPLAHQGVPTFLVATSTRRRGGTTRHRWSARGTT